MSSLVGFCVSRAFPGGPRRRRAASLVPKELRESPELLNGGMRDLEEAWDDFLTEAFSCQVWSFSVLLERQSGPRRCQAGSQEFPGAQGKPKAPERWPESSGRGLDEDLLIEAFFCQVWLFSVLLGRLQVSSCVRGSPRSSGEAQSS